MKKMINVHFPTIEKEMDMLIPDTLIIEDIMQLLIKCVREFTGTEYNISGEEVICHKEGNIVLNPKLTLSESGVLNGDTIILL